MAPEIVLAQFSDLHLRADPRDLVYDVDPAAALQRALDLLPARPDVLVLTGDLADDGSVAAYERLDALTRDVADQRYVVPGNHDDREAMAGVFGDVPTVAVEALSDAWSLALVDSKLPGQNGGRVDTAAINRLDALLTGRRNAIVALHHPLQPPCEYWECTLEGADELANVLARHPVRLVISGHVHEQFESDIDGLRCFGARSTLRELVHVDDPSLHWRLGDDPVGGALVRLGDRGECTVVPLVSNFVAP